MNRSLVALATVLLASAHGVSGRESGAASAHADVLPCAAGPSAGASAAPDGARSGGLAFPGSGGVRTTMRFRFSAPISYPATFIMRVCPRDQEHRSFFTAFFYGNDGAFQAAHDYYGFHPYPDWDNRDKQAMAWEIAAPTGGKYGGDYTGARVIFDRWYDQVAIVNKAAGATHHLFFWDWPNAANAVVRVGPANLPPPASPVLVVGDAPWNQGHEVWSGVLRGFQFYDVALTRAEIAQEIASPGSSARGSHLWYLNLDPTPTDISDKSGRGHHPEWVGTERPALWTGR